ncbi:hypothetical protein BDV95DRAFT_484191 [Massariosphaeria phaeospora]|uniref:DUF7704 domain-containing protein n=1 Tax=Massariosphaeria phaeospora TaxID=100035 RepID=A0A7C8IF52_9PLEO|nr:hypothetical protein BDV95DRAFT_484191 [Massariosphaeria phaeospora]
MTSPSRSPAPAPAPAPAPPPIPRLYRAVFLYIEPLSTLVGALFAHFQQHRYLQLTHAASAPAAAAAVPVSTSIVLTQLANLYLLLCINEALVLRATADVNVWTVFLAGLLLADFGHLYSVRLVGGAVYWRFWDWNPIDWGNVGFVYFLAGVRLMLFARVGFGAAGEVRVKRV